MRTMAMLIGWILLLPAAAGAQVADAPPCGDLEHASSDLDYYARYFIRDDLANVRDSVGIRKLPEGFSRRIVDDEKECGRVFGKLMSHLARLDELERFRPHGFDFAIFRYGPYYAVLVAAKRTRDPGNQFSTGYADLFLFRASNLQHLGRIVG